MEGYHQSVLLKEVIEALGVVKDKWFLDGTLGDGGCAVKIFELGGIVFGIDVDPEALQRVSKRLEELRIDKSRYKLVQGNFRDIKILKTQTELKDQKFAGAILDLGVSSLQLGSPERGFSFARSGPLDMRMDPTLQVRALDLVNGLHAGELYELFNKLGEERFARKIADTVVLARKLKRIESTQELADLVAKVYGRRKQQEKIHPATRVFQALRIAVNDELNALKEGLPQILKEIEKNGVILVISFHSLEDRIVKNAFREWQDRGLGQALTKKPIVAGELEIATNPRSRSAKLRIFKKQKLEIV